MPDDDNPESGVGSKYAETKPTDSRTCYHNKMTIIFLRDFHIKLFVHLF